MRQRRRVSPLPKSPSTIHFAQCQRRFATLFSGEAHNTRFPIIVRDKARTEIYDAVITQAPRDHTKKSASSKSRRELLETFREGGGPKEDGKGESNRTKSVTGRTLGDNFTASSSTKAAKHTRAPLAPLRTQSLQTTGVFRVGTRLIRLVFLAKAVK